MKKLNLFLSGFIIISLVFLLSFIYYSSKPDVYPLKGTYQGLVFNPAEKSNGIYTINFVEDKVNFFSSQFSEAHINGVIKKTDQKNEYEFVFTDLKLHCTLLNQKEMQLTAYDKDYIFLKKSDVPINDK